MDTSHPPTHETEHLSLELLATLAEEGRSAADARTLDHLACCRTCMAAYADAVRYRTAWVGSQGMFEPAGAEPGAATASRPRGMNWLPLAAGLAIVLGIGAWLLVRPAPRLAGPSGPIAGLLERASSSDLVLPGGERGAARPAEPYRGDSSENRAVEAAVEELRVRYEHGGRSIPDLLALATALTASGRNDLAHDYVVEGRARAPEHAGFLLLAAAIERREGNLVQAERLLRQARAKASGDVTLMLDHAIVLSETGANDEARALLQEVTRQAPGSPLAERAERLSRSLGPN